MTQVQLIGDNTQLEQAFNIRKEVFVEEQKVALEDEIDAFEDEARHFLATLNNQPCGAARWRYTTKGIKLERFAVLPSFRGKGVASALVQAVLDDIAQQPDTNGKPLYMHAQVEVVPLYKKFGFEITGDLFVECDIEHYPMEKKN